ncbi:terminase small subunit [Lactobacillus apis]|uniref:terminase small subunit n=1 Tax=Lactobacillus apis TaxID=303541 RepID=UPI00242B5ED4|nr:terminase small subunit [Lactobacillus apis]
MKDKLTVKQRKFADEYMISGNATDAAIKAGYSKKSAYSMAGQNLKKHEIIKYITKRQKNLESEKIAQQKEIFEYLSSVMRGEQIETVMTADGPVETPVSVKDRINAAKELLRRNPGDPLIKAQTEKAIAEAKVATVQAEELEKITDSSVKKMNNLTIDELKRLAHLGDTIDEEV